MNDALASHLEHLAGSYFPDQGDIQVVLAAFADDQEFIFTYRRQKNAASPAADENTIFEIGAVTMTFTACLLADMVTRKEVRLSDPVKRFLPADVRVPSYHGQEITLLDLGNHTSALPRIPGNFPDTIKDPADPCCDYTVDDLYAFLAQFEPRRPIGWRRDFSNLGMGLLGHALALAAECDFQELVSERIGKPLNLRDTTVAMTPKQQQRLIQGHSTTGQPAGPWSMGALVGAGGLRSTARDLRAFLRTHREPESPLAELMTMAMTPRPKSGRPAPGLKRFGATSIMCALALAALWHFPIMPGTGWFALLCFAPVLLAGIYGGTWPSLLAAGMQTGGTWLLYGDPIDAALRGGACLLIAWVASTSHRRRERPEVLGWECFSMRRNSPRIYWQHGETGGHAAFVGMTTGQPIEVVVLANCARPLMRLGHGVLALLQDDIAHHGSARL